MYYNANKYDPNAIVLIFQMLEYDETSEKMEFKEFKAKKVT